MAQTPNASLTDGKIFIGNTSNVTREVTLSGDVTVSNAGVTAIGAAKVTAAMVSLASAKVLVGNASNVAAAVTLSGDVTNDNAGVTAIGAGKVATAMHAANAVDTAALAKTTIQYASVSLTNAQIKALRATPISMVAAQGAGTAIEFVSAVLILDVGANVLSETADNLQFKYINGTGVAVSQTVETTGFIDQTGDIATNALPKIDVIATKAQCENVAIVLHNTGDGEFADNAANDTLMRVKVAYRVHTTNW